MMARELRRFKVTAGSEIADLLEAASTAPLLLEKDGELYRLNREEAGEDIWASYDPDEVRKAVAKYAGSWKDVDLEAFKALIYCAREEGTKPIAGP